jgi:hypothetical protein
MKSSENSWYVRIPGTAGIRRNVAEDSEADGPPDIAGTPKVLKAAGARAGQSSELSAVGRSRPGAFYQFKFFQFWI